MTDGWCRPQQRTNFTSIDFSFSFSFQHFCVHLSIAIPRFHDSPHIDSSFLPFFSPSSFSKLSFPSIKLPLTAFSTPSPPHHPNNTVPHITHKPARSMPHQPRRILFRVRRNNDRQSHLLFKSCRKMDDYDTSLPCYLCRCGYGRSTRVKSVM